MADLMPKNHNEVLVTFSDKSRDVPKFSARRLSLTAKASTRQIGRSSSRYNTDLSASPTNAWFDNAVMSREHAEIIWDSAAQLVFIRDTGSLHGTSLNGFQLPPWTKKRIQVGDVLKFGAPVEKELKAFHPSEVQISSIDLGPPQLPLNQSRTNTFTVPDDSEPEEVSDDAQEENMYSDSDDGGVARSAMLVQQIDVQPAKIPAKHFHAPTIDLTNDAQEALSVNRPSPSVPDHTPSLTKVDQTRNTTFAPALRYQEPSSPTELFETALSPIALDHSPEADPAALSDSLIGGFMDDSGEADEDMTILGLALPKAPPMVSSSAPTEANTEDSHTAQFRQKIVDRMALCGEVRESVDHFPPPSSSKEDSTGSKQAQAAYCGQKRKFVDFDFPEPDMATLLSTAVISSRPETVSLAQLAAHSPPSDQPTVRTSQDTTSRQAEGYLQKGSSTVLPLAEPPRKKMRRVAEAMGYAALGGLAVMSALIATAPDL